VDGVLRPERKYPTAKSIMTFLAYFIVDAGWEWIEADVIASPAWSLARCAFSATASAACARVRFIA
jgi:hypothetical protein